MDERLFKKVKQASGKVIGFIRIVICRNPNEFNAVSHFLLWCADFFRRLAYRPVVATLSWPENTEV
jgi:hypothetical protein